MKSLTLHIITIGICILLILWIKKSEKYKTNPDNIILYDDLFSQLKTGDIIAFKADDMDLRTKYLLSEIYSHLSFVYKINNTFYLLELTGDEGPYRVGFPEIDGFHLTLLKPRLETYYGRFFVCFLNKELTLDRIQYLTYLIHQVYPKMKYTYKFPLIVKHCMNIDEDPESITTFFQKNHHCTQFVMNILSDLKIAKLRGKNFCLRPRVLDDPLKYLTFIDDYSYSKPKQIVFEN